MRKRIHTLLALTTCAIAALAVSCNKDNKDPESGGGSGSGGGGTATITEASQGNGAPNPTELGYYVDKRSKTLYKRAASGIAAIVKASLSTFAEGNKLYVREGVPDSSVGAENDFYVNTKEDTKVYQKKSGTWTEVSDEIYIRDERFRNALLTGGEGILKADTNGDGKISKAEALAAQAVRVPNVGISSLDGIEHFRNIQVLEATNNALETVNLNMLTALQEIRLKENRLKGELDFSLLSNLQNGKVEIMKADSGNSGVTKIKVYSNNLARSLNTSDGTTKYTASSNVDRILDELDPILLTKLLALSPSPDRNGDGAITISEADRYSGRIDIESSEIRSLKGLEYFKKIKSLRVSGGSGRMELNDNSKTISFSDFSEIESFGIYNSNLKELEIRNAPKLTKILVTNGSLDKIAISEVAELQELNLQKNSLTAIAGDFFNTLTKIKSLNLLQNSIQGEINLRPIQNLTTNAGSFQIVRAYQGTRTNSDVTSIIVNTVDEETALNIAEQTSKYTSVTGGGSNNTPITFNSARLKKITLEKLKEIDRSLYGRRSDNDPITQSDVDKITEFTVDNNVNDLTGLETFRKLKKLTLYPQGPTTIDVSTMLQLEEITLSGSGTIQHIIGDAPRVKLVELDENRNITKLDLRGFPRLEEVRITEANTTPNHIECIAVPSGKEQSIKDKIIYSKTGSNGAAGAAKETLYRSKVRSTACD
jgi:leucine rich repeat domain protein